MLVAAICLLLGLVAAWAYRDKPAQRGLGVLAAVWGGTGLASGSTGIATIVTVAALVVFAPLGFVVGRARDRRDPLRVVRRGVERLDPGSPGRRWCAAALRDGEVALSHLRRLSFASAEERVLIGGSLESLLDLGRKLDEIDASLVRSSAIDLRPTLGDQAFLEEAVGEREGADGEWFTRVVSKRREVLGALEEGSLQLRAIRDKAVWMTARQDEAGYDDEVELIDPERALEDVRAAGALIDALAEGVGEVHLGPITRL
jgi:uncharacterized membrane protein YtjA (UPF0391 family)